jgi:hypothetical protein
MTAYDISNNFDSNQRNSKDCFPPAPSSPTLETVLEILFDNEEKGMEYDVVLPNFLKEESFQDKYFE